jgi:NADH dehydrogenase/NADH:ubiquinone oxidoreductase subunit G
MLRGEGRLEARPWRDAVARVCEMLKENARVVASANLSNEELFLAKKLLVDNLGLEVVVPTHVGEQRKVKNGIGYWVSRVDAHANSTGADLFGLRTVDEAQLKEFLMASTGPILILDNRAVPWLSSDEAATLCGQERAVLARLHTALSKGSAVVLPCASWAETEGTYTSSSGRVQLAQRAMPPKGQAKPVWEFLGLLAVELGVETEPVASARAVFEELVAEVPAFAGMSYRRLEVEPGLPVLEEVPHVG